MSDLLKKAKAVAALEAGWWVMQRDDCIEVTKGSYSCPEEHFCYDPDFDSDDEDAEMRFDFVGALAKHADALGLSPDPDTLSEEKGIQLTEKDFAFLHNAARVLGICHQGHMGAQMEDFIQDLARRMGEGA